MRWTIGIFIFVFIVIGLFFAVDGPGYLNFETLKSSKDYLIHLYEAQPLLIFFGYVGLYTLITALSLPGVIVMTLAGGLMFGFLLGAIAASVASTIGAILAFLIARYIARDWVQMRFEQRLKTINAGIEQDGVQFLFMLRLVPLFPFFIINIVMGLTHMRGVTYALVTWIGMLPGTAVYTYAGTALGKIERPADIFSVEMIVAFALIGVFPLVAKKIYQRFKPQKVSDAV